MTDSRQFSVAGAFRDDASARMAALALQDAGFPAGAIAIRHEPSWAPRVRARSEMSFLARLVWIIVFWSIPGTIIGALAGWGIAVAVGIDDTTGTVLMVVSFAIFGHLIAGIWAGYLLLADRSEREFAPPAEAPPITVTVRCANRVEIDRAQTTLNVQGAASLRSVAADQVSGPQA